MTDKGKTITQEWNDKTRTWDDIGEHQIVHNFRGDECVYEHCDVCDNLTRVTIKGSSECGHTGIERHYTKYPNGVDLLVNITKAKIENLFKD